MWYTVGLRLAFFHKPISWQNVFHKSLLFDCFTFDIYNLFDPCQSLWLRLSETQKNIISFSPEVGKFMPSAACSEAYIRRIFWSQVLSESSVWILFSGFWHHNLICVQGANFSEVIQMTDIFEGSIIRLARRLDEFLNQVRKFEGSLFLSLIGLASNLYFKNVLRLMSYCPSFF